MRAWKQDPEWVPSLRGTVDGITVEACYRGYANLNEKDKGKNEYIVREVAKILKLPWVCIRQHHHNYYGLKGNTMYTKVLNMANSC